MNKSLVSVIVPIYNAQKYLSETVESILGQSYVDLEIILVNHASTDGSVAIISKYKKLDNRIKVINLDVNTGGPAYPRNIGMDNSKGEYIAFLDADDVWLPTKIEKQLEIFQKNEKIDIVHTMAYTIDTNSKVIGMFNNQKTIKKLNNFMTKLNILYITNYININTVMMKNNSDIQFRENKYIIAIEDWFFWIDHIHADKIEYLIKEKLINYRVNINSTSDRGSDKTYRKIFYMNAILFNENKITFSRFVFNNVITGIKFIIKRIK